MERGLGSTLVVIYLVGRRDVVVHVFVSEEVGIIFVACKPAGVELS